LLLATKSGGVALARNKFYGQANYAHIVNTGIYFSKVSVIACLTLLAQLSDESYSSDDKVFFSTICIVL